MGLKLAKLSVNRSLDAQGMVTAIEFAFGRRAIWFVEDRVSGESGCAQD